MHSSAPENTPERGSALGKAAFSAAEVAGLLGHGVRYVRTLIATGELVSFKSGRLRKVAAADLDDYIARQREAAQRARETASA